MLIRVSTVLSLRFCSRRAFHSRCVSSKQGREDTSKTLILKAFCRNESRLSPERKESIFHKLILTELCLFKPICGAFKAEEKNSRREGLLCRARGTNNFNHARAANNSRPCVNVRLQFAHVRRDQTWDRIWWPHKSQSEDYHFEVENLYNNYSMTTWIGAVGRRLSNHNGFWKQKILELFSNS